MGGGIKKKNVVDDTGKGGGWLNVHYFKEKNDVEPKTIVSMTKTKKCVQCGNLFVTGRKKKCNTEITAFSKLPPFRSRKIVLYPKISYHIKIF